MMKSHKLNSNEIETLKKVAPFQMQKNLISNQVLHPSALFLSSTFPQVINKFLCSHHAHKYFINLSYNGKDWDGQF